MIPVQSIRSPVSKAWPFSGEPASFFTGVVAGTEGCSLRRWNSGGGRAALHCGSQDVSLEQTSAVQVVCGAGDVEPIARRWEKRSTRCDPKCGQRVGPRVTWLETDRLVTENAQETDLGYSVSENDARVEDSSTVP